MNQPGYFLWKIRYSRFGMWYLMHHDDEFIGKCFKHSNGYWVVHPEGHARVTRGLASRHLCAEFILDWLNGPEEIPSETSHMEYSVDGVVWYREKERLLNWKYMRWVTIGITVEKEQI